MPFTRRPDSWLSLSGPPELSNGTGDTVPGSESLPGFVSEAQPPPIVAPTVAASTARDTAYVGSYRATPARRRRSAGRRRASAAAMFTVIAASAAGAILITSLGGSDQPSTKVPPTSQAVAPKRPPPVVAVPTLPPDPRWTVDAETPDPPSSSSPVAATTRAIGTTGRRTAVPSQANRTAGAASASNQGSLAIRSAPQGARVFVNGTLVGSTPLVLDNLRAGARTVHVEADGYEGWSASTTIVANQQTRLSVTLARLHSPTLPNHAVPR